MNRPGICSRLDLEEARLLQGRLRQLFHDAQPGAQDPDSLKEVRRLCDRALLAVDDEFCQDQICEVERHAAKLFSPGGVMFQRRLVLESLEAIGDRLASLQAISRSADTLARAETVLEKR